MGAAVMAARDFLARGLVRIGVRPNMITLAGCGFTVAAGVFLAAGAGDLLCGAGLWGRWLQQHNPAGVGLSAWNLWAFAMLIASAACDMLDGAVSRLGDSRTTFGAFLDSTLDRVSDFAIFGGIAVYYASRGNVTYTLLAMLAVCHAFNISYTRARAEDLIPRCRVGYWQRGERYAAVLISLAAFNVPAMLWQQAISPAFTVWRRVWHTWQVTNGRTPNEDPRQGTWFDKLRLWRWPRMTWPYDLVTGLNVAWLIFAPIPQTDVLRNVLGW